MSLNGLDGLDVKEAHDAAIGEPGGWFLLKYVSRDEVDILGRGSGGILEIRKAIASYEDPSPLFGFLRYRRRNVVIKYVPEDCSRLVQARVTVHFNAVTDRFSPHDTVFSIGTAKELKDSALSAACSLHTASGSASSSTSSLRRRRLMEIAEDEEEDRRQSTVMEERALTIKAPSIHESIESPFGDSSGLEIPTSSSHHTFETEPTTEPDSEALSLTPSISIDPSIHSATDYDSPRKSTDQGRPSLQDSRPELNSYYSYPSNGRPKVKLGPRPSLDAAGQSQTSGSTNYRPVSTLPAGLKLFSRSSKRPNERPQSQFPTTTPSMTISPPTMDEVSETSKDDPLARPHTSEGRPTTSSGASFKSTISTSTLTSKTPSITPEKARLMKALELRKKKMHAPQSELLLPLPPSDGPDKETTIGKGSSVTTADDMDRMPPSPNGTSNGYSGVIVESSSMPSSTEFSATANNTRTPASPFALSEQTGSTPASSVSGSTDETVHASNENRQTVILHDTTAESVPTPQDDDRNTKLIEETNPEVLPEPLETVHQPKEIVGFECTVDQSEVSSPEVPKCQESASVDVLLPIEEMKDGVTTESKPEPQANGVPPATEVSQDSPPAIDEGSGASHPNSVEQPAIVVEDDKKTVELEAHAETLPPALKTPVREMKIPRSKFSVQNLKENDSPMPSSDKDATKPTERNADTKNSSPKKRKGLMEPIRTDLHLNQRSRPTSEIDIFNDDELMEELQSATMQEAKPISVSKSPMKSLFPQDVKKGLNVSDRFSRAFSNPLLKNEDQHLSPYKSEPSRSVSASAYLNRINQQQQAAPLAKKVNLGSGISQRIKALEKLSSTGAGSATSPGAGVTAGPSPTFFAVRKSNTAGSKSPSIAERANSLTRHTPSPSVSRESSPEQLKNRDRSFSIQSRKDALNSSPTNASTRSRPETISVTARIIRDTAQLFPLKSDAGKNPLDRAPLDLKQSPLVIDHKRAVQAVPEPTEETTQERRLSNPPKGAKKERRSSITVVKELISETRNSFAERRKSMTIEPNLISSAISSIRSPSRPPSTHQNSPSVTRPLSISSRRSSRDYSSILSASSTNVHSPSTSEENVEKKGSRASRMLHRMSSSLSSGRKTLARAMSPTVREESEPPSTGVSMSPSYMSTMSAPTTTTVEMGDVNVQFPDNLLWKRRAMRLDSQGFLILTQSQAGKTTEKSAGVKKYHLSDFRAPAIPDMEVEELPNSVVLDFIDGSGLQFACEDRGGQLWVLQKLQEAHSMWAAYGQ